MNKLLQVFKPTIELLPDLPKEAIKKIIILVETPFNKRHYNRFGIEILRDNGFDVEVWEICPIVRAKTFHLVKDPDPVDYERYRRFVLKREIIKALNNCRAGSLIISYLIYRMATFSVFKAISKARIPYCNYAEGSVRENIPGELSLWSYIARKVKLLTKNNIIGKIDSVFSAVAYRYLDIHPPAFTFVSSGKIGLPDRKKMQNKNSEVIQLHSFDYDIYLHIKSKQRTFQEDNYAVFLDEYMPFHPDYFLIGLEPYSCAQDYYPALCDYFDKFESQHKLQIIIAAHPKSDYENHPDYFSGRQIIRGSTAELVKEAKVVLLHSSTSVNFAVLFRKPMLFLTTHALNSSPQRKFQEPMIAHFKQTPVNVNMPYRFEENNIMPIDNDLYDDDIDKYIKAKESPCELSWQIFSDRIKLIYQKK